MQPHTESADPTHINSDLLLPENFETQKLDEVAKVGEETDKQNHGIESGQPPLDRFNGTDVEPVNYEDNGLLWHPSEPEDEEDEREPFLFDDDDGVREDSTGEWSYLRSSSFGSGESRSRDRSNEEHRKAMKKIVDGHFRALITQLLQVEDLPVTEDSNQKSWLDIITALSWEAATSLKPDTSMGGGMDPGGYVKVKYIACGHRNDRCLHLTLHAISLTSQLNPFSEHDMHLRLHLILNHSKKKKCDLFFYFLWSSLVN